LVKSLSQSLGPDKIFFGGMAGDDWALKGTFVFTNEKETYYGMVALVLNSDKIALKGMAVTGWKPLGITRTVTHSKGNLLYEIDGKSAVELYFKYLGKEDKLSEENFNIFDGNLTKDYKCFIKYVRSRNVTGLNLVIGNYINNK
jgi:hypothetical protein